MYYLWPLVVLMGHRKWDMCSAAGPPSTFLEVKLVHGSVHTSDRVVCSVRFVDVSVLTFGVFRVQTLLGVYSSMVLDW